jgi:hypothetical protein
MSYDYHKTMIHEIIHARQQVEMAWVFFFLWYFVEFLVKLLIHCNFLKAYLSLSHEREAYRNENTPGYLANRKPYAWIRFICG